MLIRPAMPADTSSSVPLIHMSMGRVADFLFGCQDSAKAGCALTRLFALPHNRFSYQFADVVEEDGQVIGLGLNYPGNLIKSLEFSTGRQLLSFYGLVGFIRFLRKTLPLVPIREAEPDEYFIHSLAVLPPFQGQGIGTRLLSWAEARAQAMGFTKSSLVVEVENRKARRLYERLGYRIVSTQRAERLRRPMDSAGFHRMVKVYWAPACG